MGVYTFSADPIRPMSMFMVPSLHPRLGLGKVLREDHSLVHPPPPRLCAGSVACCRRLAEFCPTFLCNHRETSIFSTAVTRGSTYSSPRQRCLTM